MFGSLICFLFELILAIMFQKFALKHLMIFEKNHLTMIHNQILHQFDTNKASFENIYYFLLIFLLNFYWSQ
jgi:hypothetical protein